MSQVWCAAAWLEQKPAPTPALCGIVWTCLTYGQTGTFSNNPNINLDGSTLEFNLLQHSDFVICQIRFPVQ